MNIPVVKNVSKVTDESARSISKLAPTAYLIALMASLTALGQFASNVYLPALPAVSAQLHVSMQQVQWTLAIFLIVFGVGQLIYGPLSDRFGRLGPLRAGLAVYVLGSIAAAVAPTLAALLAARTVQAAGAAAGIVIARAIVRDTFEGAALARVLALIMIVFGLAPSLSPLIGGLATDLVHWRATFWLATAFGIVVVVGLLRIPETNLRRLARLDFATIAAGYATVLTNDVFLLYAIPSALIMGSLSAFFAGSPEVLIGRLGVSPTEYGFYPPLAGAGFAIGGIVVRALSGKRSSSSIVTVGLCTMLVGALMLAVAALLGALGKYQIIAAMVVHVTGLGLVAPTALAAALGAVRELIGTASAVLGFLQMAAGALATLVVSLTQPAVPFASFPAVMLVLTALSLSVFIAKGRRG